MVSVKFLGKGGGHPCTMIVRRAHWAIPTFNIWGIPLSYLCGTRFSQFLIGNPGQSFLQSVILRLLAPMVWFSLFHWTL